MKKNTTGIALVSAVTAVAFLFGLSFVFSTIALRELRPLELMSVRWVIPAIIYCLGASFGLIKVSFKGKPFLPLLLLVLVQPILYASFETLGIKMTTASESSIFVGAIPLAVIPLEALILKKKPSHRAVAGVLAGFAGIIFLIVFAPGAAVSGKMLGYLFLILTMLMGASNVINVSRAAEYYSSAEISFAMSIGGALVFNIMNLTAGNGFHAYSVLFSGGQTTLAILFLGVGCGFVAYRLYNFALSSLSPTVASCVVTNAINVVGVVSGILITHDLWGWYTVVGVLLTIIGIVLAATAENKT